MTKWAEDRTSAARAMWLSGKTASFIAGRLGGGLTKDAVLGKMHKLGLSRFKRANSVRPPKRRRTGSESAKDREAVRRVRRAPEFKSVPLPPGDAWKPLPGSLPIPLLDLTDKTCRWPIGEDRPYLFCGCPVHPGSSYCKTHADTSEHHPPVFPANDTETIPDSDTSALNPFMHGKEGHSSRADLHELST